MIVIILCCKGICCIKAVWGVGGWITGVPFSPARAVLFFPNPGQDPQRPALNRVLDLWATLQEGPGDAALLVLRY